MNSNQTQCSKCKAEILLVTAEKTGGVCMKCKNEGEGKVLQLIESVDFGLRSLMAVGFGIGAAILGYTLGAVVWSGLGILLSIVLIPVGLLYGFFLPEINFCIRLAFRAIRAWFGF
jgi:hypothetical protein